VQDVADRYVKHLQAAGRKPSTIAAVRGHVKHWIVPFLGDKPIDKLNVDDVRELVLRMKAGRRPGKLKREKPLAPKSIQNTIGTLNAIVGFAMREGWATVNPVARVTLPKVASHDDIRFLEPVEVVPSRRPQRRARTRRSTGRRTRPRAAGPPGACRDRR
jgi:site-specific recombinase XerD